MDLCYICVGLICSVMGHLNCFGPQITEFIFSLLKEGVRLNYQPKIANTVNTYTCGHDIADDRTS